LQGRAGRRGVKGAGQPLCVRTGNDWVKKICAQRETLTIAGFSLGGNDWDGIYLGRRKGIDLVYAGKVRPRLRQGICGRSAKRLTPLIRNTHPLH
jgi:bifunctional non-homologous end joining protein LigD